jgi:hypothetical protein
MAKRRPHTDIAPLAMPRVNPHAKGEGDFPRGGPGRSKTPAGRSATPAQPSGEVRRQGGYKLPDLDKADRTPYERGFNPDLRSRRERNPRGGSVAGQAMSNTDMPRVGHQSATAPGSLARPGSEIGSATMDARSSVPVSIQETCRAGNTRDRFTTLEANDSDSREDNAEIDAGYGTGRGVKGIAYRNLKV